MSAPLRVGLLGFGLAGRVFHAPLLEADPRFALRLIVTSDMERRAQAERLHPDAKVVDSSAALFERAAELDLVVVASPPASHVALARAAIGHGLPVVVDKPLCATAAEGAALCEAAESADLMLTVFHNRRWDSDFLTLRSLVSGGALGEVRRFESRFERWKPAESKVWRLSGPGEGGGVVYDLGTHLVDQALQLFGPVVDLHAEIASYAGTPAPDDGFLSLRHDTGVRSHLFISSVAGQLGARFRVIGSKASFTTWGLDVQESQLATGLAPTSPGYGVPPRDAWPMLGLDGSVRRVEPVPGDYGAFYRGVEQALLEGAPPPVDPRDAVAAIAVVEQAHAGFEGG